MTPPTSITTNYMDYLNQDVLTIIYDLVIINKTKDIEDSIDKLDNILIVIKDLDFDNKYIKKMFTTSRDNNGEVYNIYDNNFHVNPNINLRQEFKARSINIQIINHFNIRTYDGVNNLQGTVDNWLSRDITHNDKNHNIALIIDYAIQYMLSAPVTVYNRGWEYNVINSIMWDYDDSDDEEDTIDGVLNFIIETTSRRWDGVVADSNPEDSRVAIFE